MDGSYALGWARSFDADQLAAFIDDLWGAASGDSGLDTLDAIEKVLAEHRRVEIPAGCPLTRTQLSIIIASANGEEPQSTARRLGIARTSVYTRRDRAFRRLGVRHMTHAIAVCMAHGWIKADDLRLPELPRRTATGHLTLHQQAAADLREDPGTWQPVTTYANRRTAQVAASRIRRGRMTPYRPSGAYEATAVTEGRTHRVDVRYVGRPTTPATPTERALS